MYCIEWFLSYGDVKFGFGKIIGLASGWIEHPFVYQ